MLQSDKLIYTNRGLLPPTFVRILGLILIPLGILAAGFFVFAAVYTKEWWVALLSVAVVILFMMPIAAMNTIEVWLKNDTLVYKEYPFDLFPAKPIPLHSIQDVYVERERIRTQTVYFITVQHFDRSVTNFGSGRSRGKIAEVVESIRQNLPGVQLFQQAMSFMDDANYFEAIRLFTNILAENPQNADAWYFMGMAKWQTGEPKRALGDFDKCIELDSQNAVAYMQRALLHDELGLWEQALTDLEAHIELLPGVADHPKVRKMKEELRQKVGEID